MGEPILADEIGLFNSAIRFLSFITLVRVFTFVLRSLIWKLQSGPFSLDSYSLSFTTAFPSHRDSDHVVIPVLTGFPVSLFYQMAFFIILVIFDHISDRLFEDAFNMDASATNFVDDFRLELTYISFSESIIGSSIPIFIHLVLLLPLFIESKTGSKAMLEKASNN